MLKSVTVTNFKGETLEMELAHPEKTGLCIYNIEGLGGGKANINTSESATGDGSWYNSARADSRNIVVYIKLLADVEENRHKMYQYFPLKTQIRLLFTTDQRSLYIDGYVESNETPIFSSEEFSTISVICPDPNFYNVSAPYTLFSGTVPNFEFPFWDDSAPDPDVPPPIPPYNPNYISNFDFLHPFNTSNEAYFTASGETINDWFFENPSVGNGAIFLQYNGIQVTQYVTNSSPIRWYTIFGKLVHNGTYTASFLTLEGMNNWTFTINRPDLSNPYENVYPDGSEDITYKIAANAGSDDYRFEIGIRQSVTTHTTLVAVKVEEGSNQTLAEFKDDQWVLIKDPGTDFDPYPGTIELGFVESNSRALIHYDGNVDVGLTIDITVVKPSADITIYNVSSGEHMELLGDRIAAIAGGGIKEGDVIHVCTARGHKAITVTRSTGVFNVLGCLSRSSKWLGLVHGDNIFQIVGSSDDAYMFSTFYYNEAYAGL